MDYLILTSDELHALEGLPYMQQILYIRGIKPYMDRQTGVTGIKRRISYQSLREVLYVEPIAGTQNAGSPSYDQVRRAVKQLVQKGLLEVQPARKQLIFKCVLALRDRSVQNKAATWPPVQADTKPTDETLDMTRYFKLSNLQTARPKTPQAATPHKDNNYLFFLLQKFDAFWESYPQKQGKQKALEVFKTLNPDEALASKIITAIRKQVSNINEQKRQGLWVPNWKHPANWLAQQCWEDEINTQRTTETPHAKRHTYSKKQSSSDLLWESCKGGADFDFEDEQPTNTISNVIAFKKC